MARPASPPPRAHSAAPATAPALPPRDFPALRAAVIERRAALPKRLAQVAAFAIDHPEDMAFGTAAVLAGQLGVQPSTLVRFAQAFGFSGFSALQGIFRTHMRGQWPEYHERVQELHASGPVPSLLEGFAHASIRSIERLMAGLSPQRIETAIGLLAGAETIYLIAARRAYAVAAYLTYALGRLGLRHTTVDHAGLMGPETIGFASPRDVVLAISFTPYTQASIDLAAMAHKAGVPVIAITDSPFSPLVPLATVWLEVAEADHVAFRSLSATITLAMTLAAGAAERRADA